MQELRSRLTAGETELLLPICHRNHWVLVHLSEEEAAIYDSFHGLLNHEDIILHLSVWTG